MESLTADIEWKEIVGVAPPIILSIETEDSTTQISLKSCTKLQSCLESSSIRFVLISKQTEIASSVQKVQNLVQGTYKTSVDKWILFKNQQKKVIKAKLTFTFNKKKLGKKTLKRRSSTLKEQISSHLDNLALKEIDLEEIEAMWENRPQNNDRTLRITFESDSAGRLQAEGEFELPDSLTPAYIAGLSGPETKKAIRVLIAEVKELYRTAQRLPKLKKEYQQKCQARKLICNGTEEAMRKAGNSAQRKETDSNVLFAKNNDIRNSLTSEKEKLSSKETELEELKTLYFTEMNNSYKQKAASLLQNDQEAFYDTMNTRSKALLKNRYETQAKVESALSKQKEKLKDLENKNQVIKVQILQINEESEALREKIERQKNKNQPKLNFSLSDSSNVLEESEKTFKDLQKQQHLLVDSLQGIIDTLASSIEETAAKNKKLLDLKRETTQNLGSVESEVQEIDSILRELERRKLESDYYFTIKQASRETQDDKDKFINQVNEFQTERKESRVVSLEALSRGASLFLEETKKAYQETIELNQLVDFIDTTDIRMDPLKDRFGEVKKRNPNYTPVDNDPVDQALAKYLNSIHTLKPVRFKRIEPGKYLFGTRKVPMKFINGNLLMKGPNCYMTPDEFLANFTTKEAVKDPLFPITAATPKTASKAAKAFLSGTK